MNAKKLVSAAQMRITLLVHASFRNSKTNEQWWADIGADVGLTGPQACGLARHYELELPEAHCTADNCESHVFAKGLCTKHYFRMRTHGCVNPVSSAARAKAAPCHPNKKHVARGLCSACYKKWWETQR